MCWVLYKRWKYKYAQALGERHPGLGGSLMMPRWDFVSLFYSSKCFHFISFRCYSNIAKSARMLSCPHLSCENTAPETSVQTPNVETPMGQLTWNGPS